MTLGRVPWCLAVLFGVLVLTLLLTPSCDEPAPAVPDAPIPAPPPPPEPPAVPSGLQVVGRASDFVEWRWSPVEGVDGYDVQFSTNEAFTAEHDIIGLTAEQITYRRDLPHSTTGYLRVRSAAKIGSDRITSAWSEHVRGTTPPPEPGGLRVAASGADFLEWGWAPVKGVSGYDVQFSATGVFGSEAEVISRSPSQIFYRREALPSRTTAYLRVRSAAEIGGDRITSAWSGHVGGTTLPPEPPPEPGGLRVADSGADFLEWDWAPVKGVSGYDVQFSATGVFGSEAEVISRSPAQTFYRREGLASRTHAYLRVRSAAEIGSDRITSAWSGHVRGTTDEPPPPLDLRQSPLCESVSVASITPIREVFRNNDVCGDYEIAFSVTTDLGDSMALDFLRPYKVTDWDVTVSEDEIRHELKVLWQPHSKRFQWRSDVPEMLPMTILTCPEEQWGPVLACSDRSCEIYDSEESIPSYWHEPAPGILRALWPYSEIRTLREGESLEVPVGYEIRQPLSEDVYIEMEVGGGVRATRRDFDFDPPLHVLKRGTTGSGVFRFVLTVKPNQKEQDDVISQFRFRSQRGVSACLISVGGIRLRITD